MARGATQHQQTNDSAEHLTDLNARLTAEAGKRRLCEPQYAQRTWVKEATPLPLVARFIHKPDALYPPQRRPLILKSYAEITNLVASQRSAGQSGRCAVAPHLAL